MWKKVSKKRTPAPRLERLEDRTTPAKFTVTTPLDVVAADGKLSLREAINAANAHAGPDAIVLPAGVYRIARLMADDSNVGGDFDVHGTTLFQGAGAGRTVIDGQLIDRVFDVLGTAPHSIGVTFQGLTVRNGVGGDDGGGGIRVGNADLLVQDCAVTGNRTFGDGGGISNASLPGTGNVTVVRSIINNNVAKHAGGGLFVAANAAQEGSVLRASASTIRRNLARLGGGIFAVTLNMTGSTIGGNMALRDGGGNFGDSGGIEAGTATLTSCIISGNAAAHDSGGIAATTAMLTGSTVSGNSAAHDTAGIDCTTAMLTGSNVSGNSAGGDGGGIEATMVTLMSSTVSGNHANTGSGGGILATSAKLTNSTVSGNSAGMEGGGIWAGGITLLNATVTDNSAHNGGGVFLQNGGTSSIRNSILAGNLVDLTGDGPDASGTFTSGGHNLIGDGTGSIWNLNGTPGNLIGVAGNPIDARLGPLANNGGPVKTHALLAGSPAIDRGDNAGVTATDSRGVIRIRDGDGNGSRIVDIGAFER